MSVDQIDVMLNDCLLAAGQGIGTEKPVDFDVVVWWRERYRAFFTHALGRGNSYAADRRRVTAVGRYLGQRALHHAACHDSRGFLEAELGRREVLSYPPFGHLIRVVCSSTEAGPELAGIDPASQEVVTTVVVADEGVINANQVMVFEEGSLWLPILGQGTVLRVEPPA